MQTQSHTQTYANDSATSSSINTGLAQRRSLSDLYSRLLAMRNNVDPKDELHGHLSNMAEQIKNFEQETDPIARGHLQRFMASSVAAIERLTKGAK